MENEIWKDVPIEGFSHAYQISNWGRIKSKPREIEVYRNGKSYPLSVGGKIIATRTNKKTPYIYSTLIFENPLTRKKTSKTVYPHKLVAMAFVPRPSAETDKVTFIDRDPTNLYFDNLKWVSQSFLSKRAMEEHPENRNTLGEIQRKKAELSEEDKQKAISLYKGGMKLYLIAKEVGKSSAWAYSSLIELLRKRGVYKGISPVWNCSIKWMDTGALQENLLFCEYDSTPEGWEDEEIFFYGIYPPSHIGKIFIDFKLIKCERIRNR